MKVIITGSSGMVGKATLLECIDSKHVEEVLLINRTLIKMSHPKIKEIIHKDFSDFSIVKDDLIGYDACFHCMGVSALGLSEEQYSHYTFDMTMALAKTLHELNPNMVFNYVTGAGADSSEKGNIMWARVKGRTENGILELGFKDAYAFRPGAILPEKGVKSKTKLYNYIYIITKPFYPLMKKMKSVTLSSKVGIAMINSVLYPQEKKHLEVYDINKLANI